MEKITETEAPKTSAIVTEATPKEDSQTAIITLSKTEYDRLHGTIGGLQDRLNKFDEAERKKQEDEAKKSGDFEKILAERDMKLAKLVDVEKKYIQTMRTNWAGIKVEIPKELHEMFPDIANDEIDVETIHAYVSKWEDIKKANAAMTPKEKEEKKNVPPVKVIGEIKNTSPMQNNNKWRRY